MPNNLHVEAIVSNSTDVFYFKHPNTAVYTAGTPKPNALGTFMTDYSAINAGNYGPVDPSVPAANVLIGTLGAPSPTNTTTYTYVGAVRTVLDAAVVSPPAPAPTGAPTFALADSTIGRVDRSTMTTVNLATNADLLAFLQNPQTNKRGVLAVGTYQGYFEQNATWTNVELAAAGLGVNIANDAGGTCILLQGGATRTRIAFTGLKFSSTITGSSGNPLFWWNELPTIDGLEVSNCEFTCPNAAMNAMGCVQYSTSSNSGQVARNVYIHDNNIHDVGRCGIEMLSQGYDGVFRLFNLTIKNNTFANLGTQNTYGMATSLSGLFKQVNVENNSATGTRRIGYEFVNTQQATCYNNSVSSAKDGVGLGFSDDAKGFTADIYVRGGAIDVLERPFYIYECKRIHLDGQNTLWKGHRGADMGTIDGCTFDNLNMLIQSTAVETGWQWGSGTTNSVATNCRISSAGSAAAGYNPSFESVVLRSGATGNTLKNCATILGLQANGTAYAGSPATGSDGRIVDQGTGNTITNNTLSTAA